MTTAEPFDLANAALDQGTVLLEASAGTGKTYTLVGILLRCLCEGRIDSLQQALVVTFTVAATAELKERLRAGLNALLAACHDPAASRDPLYQALARRPATASRVRAALDEFDLVPVTTIHGFCKRVLDEAAFESRAPFTLEFVADPVPLLAEAAADALRTYYTEAPSPAAALIALGKFTPATLVREFQLWQRYPDVQLEPAAPDVATQLATLAAAVAAARPHLDADARRALVGYKWKSEATVLLEGDPEGHRLLARLREVPWLDLNTLASLATSQLVELVNKRSKPRFDHPLFAACDAVHAAATAGIEHLRVDLLRRMQARLAATKARLGAQSFDDLLLRLHEVLADPARRGPLLTKLRDRFRIGLIDEFQDTDARQYELFSQLFAGRPLFLVGDPKQSIYGFRGGDLQAYLSARQSAPTQATLATNWRSGPGLVDSVGWLFRTPGAFATPDLAMPVVAAAPRNHHRVLAGDGDGALVFRQLASSDFQDPTAGQWLLLVARDVANEARRLLQGPTTLDGRRLLPRDLAVLTRTNHEAVAVQQALRDQGIPAVIGKAGDVFETEEIEELELLLRAILQPRNLRGARAAMATRWWGKSAPELLAMADDDASLDVELARLDRWRQAWLRHGFVVMFEAAMAEVGTRPRLLAVRGGERRLTNFRQLVELLHQAEHQNRLSPEGLVEWFRRERAHADELDYQLRELRLESDGDAVQVLTVHGSKGLEYEVVFCPFLWHARTVKAPLVIDLGQGRMLRTTLDEAVRDRAEQEQLREDLRLLYVALTRARRRCIVHWLPGGTQATRSGLAWLLLADRQLDPAAAAPKASTKTLQARLADEVCRLRGLVAALPEHATWHHVTTVPPAPPPERPADPDGTLPPARRPSREPRPRGLHSFSSLCAGADPVDAPSPLAEAHGRATTPTTPGLGIFAFARGTGPGQCLHEILERADLQHPAAAEPLVRTRLQAHGLLDPARHPGPLDPVPTVVQLLHDLAAARPSADGPTLADLGGGPRVAEWAFTLPMPQGDLAALANAFADSSSAVARAYADRIRQLPRRFVRGFLIGFVDLVVAHDGRHHVLDWKSNHLGDRSEDYAPGALRQAMLDHDYVLQYHLYVLALHRQLRARLRDYDPERHLGTVIYPFLRGVQAGSANGLFVDRVPTDLLLALDRWLAGGTGGGR